MSCGDRCRVVTGVMWRCHVVTVPTGTYLCSRRFLDVANAIAHDGENVWSRGEDAFKLLVK